MNVVELDWTSTEERVPLSDNPHPNHSIQVLGFDPDFGVDIFAYWPASQKWTVCMQGHDGQSIVDVEKAPTHWMALPEGPSVS